MRGTKCWLALIVLCLAIGGLLPVFAADTRPMIAVLPFDDGSIKHWWWDDWDVGKGISDIMVTELLDGGKFRLVEREKIAQIIQEQDFGASGRVDQKSAAKIGKIAGVKYIVMGKVTEFTIADKGGTLGGITIKSTTARVALDGRLIDTTTAEIVAGAKGVAEKSQAGLSLSISSFPHIEFGADRFEATILGKATTDAVTQFCTNLTQKFQGTGTGAGTGGKTTGITGKVAAVSGNKVYLNIGAKDGVTAGMIFRIARVVEEVKDPDNGEVLDVITEPVCEISISEVKDATCNGPIISGKLPQKGDVAAQK